MSKGPAGRAAAGLAVAFLCSGLLAGCASWPVEEEQPEPERPESGAGPRIEPGTPAPPREAESAPRPVPMPEPSPEDMPPPAYHPAGEALVEQARREALMGNDALAGATLERALRVDGGNPWIWIELGHLRLVAGQRAAAEGLARKALSLSARDPGARSAATALLDQSRGGG